MARVANCFASITRLNFSPLFSNLRLLAATSWRQVEVVQLSRTQLGRGLELGFEVVGRLVAKGGVTAFGLVASDVVADFELGFG